MSAADPVSIKTFTSPATNNINVKSMFKTLSQNSFCTNGSPEASCFPHRLCQAITSQAKSLVQALRITYYGTPLHTGLTIVAHPATRGSTALKNGVTNVKLTVDFFLIHRCSRSISRSRLTRVRQVVLEDAHFAAGHHVRDDVLRGGVPVHAVGPLGHLHALARLLEDGLIPRLQRALTFIQLVSL